jgi:predicted metallopeptidase
MGKISIAVGLDRGFKTTKIARKERPGNSKGRASARVKSIREVVREVAGFAPYEKRIMELLRNELDKRALRFARKRLGSLTRAKRKREELGNVIRAQKSKK